MKTYGIFTYDVRTERYHMYLYRSKDERNTVFNNICGEGEERYNNKSIIREKVSSNVGHVMIPKIGLKQYIHKIEKEIIVPEEGFPNNNIMYIVFKRSTANPDLIRDPEYMMVSQIKVEMNTVAVSNFISNSPESTVFGLLWCDPFLETCMPRKIDIQTNHAHIESSLSKDGPITHFVDIFGITLDEEDFNMMTDTDFVDFILSKGGE